MIVLLFSEMRRVRYVGRPLLDLDVRITGVTILVLLFRCKDPGPTAVISLVDMQWFSQRNCRGCVP
jgi:hypothetical protein